SCAPASFGAECRSMRAGARAGVGSPCGDSAGAHAAPAARAAAQSAREPTAGSIGRAARRKTSTDPRARANFADRRNGKMLARRFPSASLIGFVLVAGLGLGCELVVDFDRERL